MREVAAPRGGWLAHLASWERSYLLVDGGAGARLFTHVSALIDRLRRVSSARHAELLVLLEPVSSKLALSIVELYSAMPRPRRLVVIDAAEHEDFPDANLFAAEEYFTDVMRIPASLGATEIARRMVTVSLQFDEDPKGPAVDPITVPLPAKQEREMATEPVVLSLGPVQSLTAGPLRLLMVADGEQVVSVTVEAGYAGRDVARSMTKATWPEAARLARLIDPLAPTAGRLAYTMALEKLRCLEPDESVRVRREATLALERAQNHLAWLVRFAELLDARQLTAAARRISLSLAEVCLAWELFGNATAHPESSRRITVPLAELASLRERVLRDRALALRTAGIGMLHVERLRAVGVSGPVLRASECGRGDVLSRLLARLEDAADDLRQFAACPAALPPVDQEADTNSPVPRGEVDVTVDGPRGRIGLAVSSDGASLVRVEWRRPSAALIALVPELLANQKLSDAEAIVASLDLAMAEADG